MARNTFDRAESNITPSIDLLFSEYFYCVSSFLKHLHNKYGVETRFIHALTNNKKYAAVDKKRPLDRTLSDVVATICATC